MQNVEDIASNLDAQVLRVLGAYQFSDSPFAWDRESDSRLSEMYWSMVQRTKNDIRAVAQYFRPVNRLNGLLQHMEDINDRTAVLRTMLLTVDLVRWRESNASSRLNPQDLRRLQEEIPAVRCALRSIMNKSSAWQEELHACLDVFALLEGPVEGMELLLSSIPSSLPNRYLVHGRILVERLVHLWSARRVIVGQAIGLAPESPGLQELVGRLNDQREDQGSIIRSFTGLINHINEVPPLYFLNKEFTARQFSGASWVFRRLGLGRTSIIEDIERLENTLNHLLDVIVPSED